MSTDKTTPRIGNTLVGGENRDAIHIAVAPVTATESLGPAQRIRLAEGSMTEVEDSHGEQGDGIVDPFLYRPVGKGERFYMFLHPETITSLRHEWTHPRFRNEVLRGEDARQSVCWLEYFAESNGMTYEQVIDSAKRYIKSDGHDYLCLNHSPDFIESPDEFWRHIKMVTGMAVSSGWEPLPFRCSC